MTALFKSPLGLFYGLLSTIFIVSTLFKPYPLSWLLKLMPVLLLITFYCFKAKNKSQYLFILGLIFSGCGDFFLDYDRQNWFIFGLAAFFVAHLCYIAAMMPVKKTAVRWLFAYLVYGVVIFSILAPHLAELFVPVFCYMLVLLIMGCTTLISAKRNGWLVMGGLFFVISDSIIGIDKFYLSLPNAALYVMLTYYLAQFCLAKGLFKQATSGS